MRHTYPILLLLLFTSLPLQSYGVPHYLGHQGSIYQANQEPLTGSANVTFSLYKGQENSVPVWTETLAVTFDDSYYSVTLGTETDLPVSLFDGSSLYLGVKLQGHDEFTPRHAILSVPYALRSEAAESVWADGEPVIDTDGNWVGPDIDKLDETTLENYLTTNNYMTGEGSALTGSGTTNSLAKFASEGELGDSVIVELDGNIGIDMEPSVKLDVSGELRVGNSSADCTPELEGSIRYVASAKALNLCDGENWLTLGASSEILPGAQLLGQWMMDDNWNDSSDNHNNATPAGNANFTTGLFDQAGNFDGSGDRAVGTLPEYDGGNTSISTMAWVKIASDNRNYYGAMSVGSTGNRQHFYQRITTNTGWDGCNGSPRLALGVDNGSADEWWCAPVDLQANHWHHVAATYDGDTRTVALYVDGDQIRTITLDADLQLTTNFYIGGDLYNDNFMHGAIDDARVYQGVVSESYIAALYADGEPETSPGASAFWPMEGNWDDASGGESSGTPQGSPGFASGKFGQAGTFNGSSARVAGTLNNFEGGNTSVTTMAWVNLTSTGIRASKGVMSIGNTGNRQHFYQRLTNTSSWDGCNGQWKLAMGVDNGSADKWWCTSAEFTTGQWYHLASVYHGPSRELRIYVDGELDRTVTLSADLVLTNQFYIGGDGYNDNFIDGMIDDAAVFYWALSTEEIAAIFNSGAPLE